MHDTVQRALRALMSDLGTALIDERSEVTWAEHLRQASLEAAAVWTALDPNRPANVGLLQSNTPHLLRSLAAGGLGGYVLVGLNPTRRGSALRADILRSDCQLILVDAEHEWLVAHLDLPGIAVVDVGSSSYDDFMSGADRLAAPRAVTSADPFMLIFTSGTSGDPKTVPVAHGLVMQSGGALTQRFELNAHDICYLSMPLFHSNAIVGGWAVAVSAGAAMAPATFSASRLLDDLRSSGATYMNYVGKPLAYVLATPEKPDDAANPLRVAFGNEASDRDIAEFTRRFGCTVWDGYGSTESAIWITRESGTPKGSIGKGMGAVAVYDRSTLQSCEAAQFGPSGALLNPDSAIGELVNTDGAGWFTGYYRDPDATADRLRHGIYWSGDLAYMDNEGWIYLAGRTDDWLRVDGENLATGPIERILGRHPAVSQVAVYGIPDTIVGDQLMAAIVLRNNQRVEPAEWHAFLGAQEDLSTKSWPAYVRFESTLPSTATNKVLKRVLTEQGAMASDAGELWQREARGTNYQRVR